ncbi:MAG: nickel pincer cofactor biosynthesis protein LarC [Chloroflexi bacterium]|nr:nickel pincer cofactor biosynthesis protein LarC [Chloroflexota bacterium]
MIGFLDCYSGISGDMCLGAVVDAGVPLEVLSDALDGMRLGGFVRLDSREVHRGVLRGTQVEVVAEPGQPHRTFRDIVDLLDGARLEARVRDQARSVFRRLVEVEGRIHGASPEDVELHEVGAIDSIADVVGTVAGLAHLGVEALYASSLPVSTGEITGRHHGALPAPSPAALDILAAAGAPLRPFGGGRELVTPTGAAIAATLARFEQPPMRLVRVGYGAGGAELPWPNVLRLWLGEPVADGEHGVAQREPTHVVVETSIDDMSPQLLAPVTASLAAAGALDVTFSPLSMKKGRQGVLVAVVARAEDEAAIADVLLRETTTLGVRVHDVRRHEAERAFEKVETPYGAVAVKLKLVSGRVVGAMPEFESVRAAADAASAPLLRVHQSAAAAAQALLEGPTRQGGSSGA